MNLRKLEEIKRFTLRNKSFNIRHSMSDFFDCELRWEFIEHQMADKTKTKERRRKEKSSVEDNLLMSRTMTKRNLLYVQKKIFLDSFFFEDFL